MYFFIPSRQTNAYAQTPTKKFRFNDDGGSKRTWARRKVFFPSGSCHKNRRLLRTEDNFPLRSKSRKGEKDRLCQIGVAVVDLQRRTIWEEEEDFTSLINLPTTDQHRTEGQTMECFSRPRIYMWGNHVCVRLPSKLLPHHQGAQTGAAPNAKMGSSPPPAPVCDIGNVIFARGGHKPPRRIHMFFVRMECSPPADRVAGLYISWFWAIWHFFPGSHSSSAI